MSCAPATSAVSGGARCERACSGGSLWSAAPLSLAHQRVLPSSAAVVCSERLPAAGRGRRSSRVRRTRRRGPTAPGDARRARLLRPVHSTDYRGGAGPAAPSLMLERQDLSSQVSQGALRRRLAVSSSSLPGTRADVRCPLWRASVSSPSLFSLSHSSFLVSMASRSCSPETHYSRLPNLVNRTKIFTE